MQKLWRHYFAVCQGKSHKLDGRKCEDKVSVSEQNCEVFVLAVSDGASSAKYAAEGADCVTRAAVQLLCKRFFLYYWASAIGINCARRITSFIQKQVRLLPNAIDDSLFEFSSTLLTVAIKDDKYIAIHIGDGVIGIERNNNESEVLSYPQNDEHENITEFITQADASEQLQIYHGNLSDITGFVLMTDGTSESLYDKQERILAPACVKLLAAARELPEAEMQEQLKGTLERVIATKTHDDCSIALIAR